MEFAKNDSKPKKICSLDFGLNLAFRVSFRVFFSKCVLEFTYPMQWYELHKSTGVVYVSMLGHSRQSFIIGNPYLEILKKN